MRPSIVVIGSGVATRAYTPQLEHAETLPQACEQVGKELAARDCDLVVFSSNDSYVEPHVVRGYLDAGGPRVVARVPQGKKLAWGLPPELTAKIIEEPDASEEWEVSYYSSVSEADGVIAFGGGRSTRIAGYMAVAQRKPIVAVAGFGAGAKLVWRHMKQYPHFTTPDELSLMGRPWSDTSAKGLVASLLDQRERKQRAERDALRGGRGRQVASVVGIGALMLSLGAILVAFTTSSFPLALTALLVGPPLAGLGGATLRGRPDEESQLLFSAFRGLGAGMATSLLYVVSQLLTTGSEQLMTLGSVRNLIWFVVLIGLLAGFTFDLVWERFRTFDATNPAALADPNPTAPAP